MSLGWVSLAGQETGIPLNAPAHQVLDRLSIQGYTAGNLHLESKFVSRRAAASYAMQVDSLYADMLRNGDRRDVQYLFDDNNEFVNGYLEGLVPPDAGREGVDSSTYIPRYRRNRRGLLRYFYQTPANFAEINTPHFRLRLNPMLNLQLARSQGENGLLFANERGAELRMDIDDKLYLYSNLLESQAIFPNYVRRWIVENNAVPGNGNFKNLTGRWLDFQNGYDFHNAVAYLGFNATRHIGIQFGHARHFVGNGYRSLFLSDFSNPYLFLKFSLNIWKLQYQSMVMELSGGQFSPAPPPGQPVLTKRFAAQHYLNYNITRNLSVGFMETVVFNRSRQMEWQYLNPVIFYRTVEASLGSPDNVLLGFDIRYNFLKRFQVYGQLLLDEFYSRAIINPEERGWWGNKFGRQLGLKYINVANVDHLDLQLEWNSVRPYTYSHFDSLNSWTHFRQPMAHPLGANFRELIAIARYRPMPALQVEARYLWMDYGEDDNRNWGGNPLFSYTRRTNDYGNFIGQGVASKTRILGLDLSWQLYHNMFLDLRMLLRRQNSANDARDLDTTLWGVGFRANCWKPNHDF